MKRFYVLGVLMFIGIIAVFSTMRAQNLELVKSSTKDSTITIELSMPRLNYLKDKTFQDNLNSQIESNVKNFVQQVRDIATQDAAGGVQRVPYEANVTTEVRYQNDEFVSFIVYYYQFTGGAHGITTFDTYNVDLKNCRLIALADIIKQDDEKIIKDSILKSIEEKKEEFFEEDAKQLVTNEDLSKRPFVIEKDGIVFKYNHYEIAPYSTGMPEFKVTWTELGSRPEFIKE
ncbi:MAG: DUF3298 and DUF4163 domain-containing protein [Thermotogaceae bacterium]|nr:DUF3298 and DUF4163 domain-containing protein [Thermotogaceae bacterium]